LAVAAVASAAFAADATALLDSANSTMRTASGFHVDCVIKNGDKSSSISADIAGDDFDVTVGSVETRTVGGKAWAKQDGDKGWHSSTSDEAMLTFLRDPIMGGKLHGTKKPVVVGTTEETDGTATEIEIPSDNPVPGAAYVIRLLVFQPKDGQPWIRRFSGPEVFLGQNVVLVDASYSKVDEIDEIEAPISISESPEKAALYDLTPESLDALKGFGLLDATWARPDGSTVIYSVDGARASQKYILVGSGTFTGPILKAALVDGRLVMDLKDVVSGEVETVTLVMKDDAIRIWDSRSADKVYVKEGISQTMNSPSDWFKKVAGGGTVAAVPTDTARSVTPAPTESTIVVRVPAAIIGADYWIYVDKKLVNAPPHDAFVSESIIQMRTPNGVIYNGAKSGLLGETENGTLRAVSEDAEKVLFHDVTLTASPGAHVVELMTRALDPIQRQPLSFPFLVNGSRYEVSVEAGSTTTVVAAPPPGWGENAAASASVAEMTPSNPDAYSMAQAKAFRDDLNAIAADPVVAAYYAAAKTKIHMGPNGPVLVINLPEGMGGSREFNADQIDALVDRIIVTYHYDFDKAEAERIAPSHIRAFELIEAKVNENNANLETFRNLPKQMHQLAQ
jgi:hypothetical protein